MKGLTLMTTHQPGVRLPQRTVDTPSSPTLPAIVHALTRLTAREREVIALVAQGYKNRAIAARLQLTESTIRHHLTDIYHKLGMTDRLELLIFAYQHDLVPGDA